MVSRHKLIMGIRTTLMAIALGLVAMAIPAMASATPGTAGIGGWSFLTFDPNWNYHNGIQLATTSQTSTTTNVFTAQVLQPINAPGQIPSVFSNKTRTIPIKYVVTRTPTTTTQTTTTDAVYPGLLKSYADPSVVSTNLYWDAPSGLKVSQITNLTANFNWVTSNNHGGSMRWQIDTVGGVTVYVYYGSPSDAFQSGTGGSGVNMMAQADARFEQQGGTPYLGTLADVLNRPAPAGTIADETVSSIGLVVDGGWGGAQAVQLDSNAPAVTIGTAAGDATYTPGTIPGGSMTQTVTGQSVADNSAPAWLYLNKVSGNTSGPIDESAINNTQGDSGGQFRQIDGMYMYNFPVSQLTDTSATYQFGIRVGSSTAAPAGVVTWGIR